MEQEAEAEADQPEQQMPNQIIKNLEASDSDDSDEKDDVKEYGSSDND